MQRSCFFTALALLAGLFNASCDPEPLPQQDPTPLALNTPGYLGPFSVPSDNPTTLEGVALGRMLFYEKKLSGDNTQSCSSCHAQEHAFADPRQFSVGIDGINGSFNAMSLQNLLWAERFFWDGRVHGLEEQALVPIQDPIEMHQSLLATVTKLETDEQYPKAFQAAFGDPSITATRISQALAQFERTLISSNSRFDKFLRNEIELTEQENLGRALFYTHPIAGNNTRGGNCGDCHLGPSTGGIPIGFDGFHNNGLDTDDKLKEGAASSTGNDRDRGKFKAPTLRNIAVTAPYMHDGRFNTLEEVLDHYNEHIQSSATLSNLIKVATNNPDGNANGIKLGLTKEEKEAILAFLNTLTDEEFLTNEAFSDPF